MEKDETEEHVREHTLFTISVILDGAKKLLAAFPDMTAQEMIDYMERLKKQLTIEYLENTHGPRLDA